MRNAQVTADAERLTSRYPLRYVHCNGVFRVFAEEFPGMCGEGDSLDAATFMARYAISRAIEGMILRRQEIPRPLPEDSPELRIPPSLSHSGLSMRLSEREPQQDKTDGHRARRKKDAPVVVQCDSV